MNETRGNLALAESDSSEILRTRQEGTDGTDKRFRYPEFKYVDFARGHVSARNHVVTIWDAATEAKTTARVNSFVTVFRFAAEYLEHCKATKSVKGYVGPCYADYLPFDIDRDGNLHAALLAARALAFTLHDRFDVRPDQLRYFFSGAKGFHLLVPSALLGTLEPSPHLPRAFRSAALAVAEMVGEEIDTSIYDANRLFRLPNTKHPSGLWKVELSWEELSTWTTDQVRAVAREPRSFIWTSHDLEPIPALEEFFAGHLETSAQRAVRTGTTYTNGDGKAAALAAALGPAFTEGHRHDVILAFSGYAAKRHLPRETALGVADILLDGEPNVADPDNLPDTINDTYDKVRRGLEVVGYTRLQEYMQPDDLARLAELLGDRPAQAAPPEADPWAEPRPLPDRLRPVEPFVGVLLPDALRPWVEDIADRMQCPPDFPAIGAMVALGSIVGRKVGIRPKRQDDWTVVSNLWGAPIGSPGVLKSPSLKESTDPLRRLEIEEKEAYDEQRRQWEAEQQVGEIKQKLQKRKIEDRLKKNGAEFQAIVKEVANEEESPAPTRKRLIVNDATVEKLGELLSENPNGLLAYRDELIGLLRSLDKEGQEGARAFYLEAWDGKGRFTWDRIGRGTQDIEGATVSVLGCIQPGVLRDYLRGAVAGGGDDGLVQRFQLAVWPDVSPEWQNVDRWPNSEARTAAFELFQRLHHLTAKDVGAETDQFDPRNTIPFLRFDAAAQEAFDEWRAALEHRLRAGGEHPMVESHLAKYRSLVPSLALLHFLADGGTGAVNEVSVRTAILWAEYLESHARRIYSIVTGSDQMPARALIAKLKTGAITDGFALRDVYRSGWSNLATKEDAQAAVDLLIDLGWLRSETADTGGRPATVYRVNPNVKVEP